MPVSRTKYFRTLSFAVLLVITGLMSTSALGQDYKEAYNQGLQAAKAKNLTAALDSFTKAAEGAKAENDTAVERKSLKIIAQIEYNIGRASMKAEKYDEAIQHFENGIKHYPTYAKNFLAKGSALKKKGMRDEAIAAFVQAATIAKAGSDTKTQRQAEGAIRDQYIYMASSVLSRHGNRATTADADEAAGYLETLQQYVEPDADVYYYMAEVHKVRGEFQDAVKFANQAIAAHRGSRSDKAKIYFVKGEALMSLGDIAGAKAAFKLAQYGTYKASAQHFIETLGTD